MINRKQNNKLKLKGRIYSIASNNCHMEYIGETSRNLNKDYMKANGNFIKKKKNQLNALVVHHNQTDQNFYLKMLL